MRVRKAIAEDIPLIKALFEQAEFTLDVKHLESVLVADDEFGPIAVMSLSSLLECTFLTMEVARQRDKIEALKHLVTCGSCEVRNLGYTHVHAFANQAIAGILRKHFKFQPGIGENLVLFVE